MTEAIGPPRRRGRPLFGLLDPDGWAWASLKAFFWFIVILFLLGYLPDRAYYFTVNPTIDLGINAVSPVNFCPPENESLPCPAPAGGILPWQKAPTQLNLPEPRRNGAAVQAGSNLLYIGGTDGKTASNKVFVSQLFGEGNFSPWKAGPDLPEPRSRFAAAFFNGSIYVVGGDDASGKPATTTWVLTPDASTGQLGTWKAVADTSGANDPKLDLKLPEARDGAVLVPAADGLLLVGGGNGSGAVNTVWKSTVDAKGALHAWAPSGGPMPGARTDGVAVLLGDFMYVYGGTDGKTPTSAVWIAKIGKDPGGASQVTAWATNLPALPAPRTSAAGFVANQAIYLVGGTDGTTPHSELYWTVPDSGTGMIKEWKHLPQSDLPTGGLAGSTAAISGSYVFLVGGQTTEGVAQWTLRSNLAPKPPFFQLGLVGATVPGLKIEGDIGPQLGLLAAAGVGTGNFILLILIGYVFAHKAQVRAFLYRLRERRRREA